MDYVGIDLHKKVSQICCLSEGGRLSEGRIRTEPRRFAEVPGRRPRREQQPAFRALDHYVRERLAPFQGRKHQVRRRTWAAAEYGRLGAFQAAGQVAWRTFSRCSGRGTSWP